MMGRETFGTTPGMQTLMKLSIIFIMSAFFLNTVESADIGANCTASTDCTHLFTICENGTCICNENFTTNLEKKTCEASYDKYCLVEKNGGGCSVPDAICKAINATKRCLCRQHYTLDEKKMECVGKGALITTSVMTLIIGAAIGITLK